MNHTHHDNKLDFINDLSETLQFGSVGIARAESIIYADELRNWLAKGSFGEMEWLTNHLDLRLDPRAMLEGCQSIIAVADHYSKGDLPPPTSPTTSLSGLHSAVSSPAVSDLPNGNSKDHHSDTWGRIARYARGQDYHKSMKNRLFQMADELREHYPNEIFRVAVDTAPVMERAHAAKAGIGYIGKNTLLIRPGIGSYFFLGEILTTLAIPPTSDDAIITDHCGSCTRCIDACPTDAIESYSVDARRCISYLTIEHRSLIDVTLHRGIGDWIFGCDICQEVCPHNGQTAATKSLTIHADYEPIRNGFDLLDILNWSEDDRRAAFTRSSMKRAKLGMMKRNALIALGNRIATSNLPGSELLHQMRSRIEQIATDELEDSLVRETAKVVLKRLPQF